MRPSGRARKSARSNLSAYVPRLTEKLGHCLTVCRTVGWCAVAALVLLAAVQAAPARAETRSLKLYNTHTGERAEIAFKKNGRFISSGLVELNRFLRDWRRNESTKMDPELFDLIWEVYQKAGSREHIHVVSGYRSPATNNMLRKRSRGVAKFSQHTRGKAMDFFLPDVKLANLRAIGLRKQTGGVGFYPTSGSPFVHMDTGNVRHWPRMTRKQLAQVFPDGKTIHVPSDGKPMPGYKQALAELKGRGQTDRQIVVATNTPAPSRSPTARSGDSDSRPIRPIAANRSATGTSFIASLFSNKEEDTEGEGGPTPPAAVGRPAAPGAIAANALPGVTPPDKPDFQSPEAEEVAEPVSNEVPILVAALPPVKPRPAAPEPTVVAALPAPAPTDPADAISALTNTPPAQKPAQGAPGGAVLAYASASPREAPRPQLPVFTAGRPQAPAGPAGKELVVAALETGKSGPADLRAFVPQRGASGERPQLSITGSFPREADPFARFASLPDREEPRLLSSDVSTRTEAFADLRHPDQRRLGELFGRPARILVATFDRTVYGTLRTDQFVGPAVVSLPVIASR